MATVKLDPAKGVQIPNMTTTERNAVSSPETGALVWNTTTSAVNQYNGSAWKEMLRSDGSAASLTAIPAGNLTGTVADARISALTASKLTGALPAISGANLTGVGVAGITSSADATAITINSSEQVGIGTGSPTGNSKVHIYNAASGQSSSNNNTELVIENDNNTGIQFLTPNNKISGLWFGDSDDTQVGRLYYSHSDNSLNVVTDNTQRIRIDSDGIKFNADTAAANALDDYEEGTFTPVYTVVGGGSHSSVSSVNNGVYTKVGRMVTIGIESYVVQTSGTMTYLKVNLPFTANSGGAAFTSGGDEFGQSGKAQQLKIVSNGTYMTIKNYDGTGPSHNGYFSLGITYQTA